MASQVSKDIPVLFLDTGKLFGETKRYRDRLTEEFGLTDVRSISPDANDLQAEDPKGSLWTRDTNRCCFLRKVAPMSRVLEGFEGWASGRKRYQGGVRSLLPHFEASDGRVKVNPLAFWTKDDVADYKEKHSLPDHPLVAEGFASIGCMPCTDRVEEGEDERAGRWRGQTKTECGIHLTLSENRRILSK
jgi:phosphoadenosine phosphosulfate reductase